MVVIRYDHTRRVATSNLSTQSAFWYQQEGFFFKFLCSSDLRHVPFEFPVEYHLKSCEPVTLAKSLPSVLSTIDSLDLDVPKT